MKGYFKQAFETFRAGEKPFASLATLILIGLIPILGQIVVLGVAFQWAREAAWGVDSPLPKIKGNFKAVCKAGGIAFVVIIGWGLAAGIAFSLVSQVPFIGYLCALLSIPLCLAVNLFIEVIALRAVIYDSLTPAFQFVQPFEMVKRDAGGLIQVFLIAFLGGLVGLAIIAVATGLVALVIAGVGFTSGLFTGAAQAGVEIAAVLLGILPLSILLFLLAYVLTSAVMTFVTCMFARALGLWMAQFKPISWGRSQDPLPPAM